MLVHGIVIIFSVATQSLTGELNFPSLADKRVPPQPYEITGGFGVCNDDRVDGME